MNGQSLAGTALGTPGPAEVRVFALTDVGRTREHNEDAFLVADLAEDRPLTFAPTAERAFTARAGALFLVADGLGGAAAGEVASHLAAEAAYEALRAALPAAADGTDSFAAALRDAVLAANGAIHRTSAERADLRGMATTLTAGALLGTELFLAQVGDSRAYLVRDGAARQLTKDQSLVQRLVDAGELTPEQAETSARRNIILQALGADSAVKVDVTHLPLRRGDLLILCSDGLSGQVRAAELATAAAEAPDLAALCAALVDRANATGGPDNITVVAARVGGDALPVASAQDAESGPRHLASLATPTNGIEPWRPDPAAAPRSPTPDDRLVHADDDLAPPAPAPVEAIAERQGRARVVYAALAAAAASAAAFTLYRLLTG